MMKNKVEIKLPIQSLNVVDVRSSHGIIFEWKYYITNFSFSNIEWTC